MTVANAKSSGMIKWVLFLIYGLNIEVGICRERLRKFYFQFVILRLKISNHFLRRQIACCQRRHLRDSPIATGQLSKYPSGYESEYGGSDDSSDGLWNSDGDSSCEDVHGESLSSCEIADAFAVQTASESRMNESISMIEWSLYFRAEQVFDRIPEDCRNFHRFIFNRYSV